MFLLYPVESAQQQEMPRAMLRAGSFAP